MKKKIIWISNRLPVRIKKEKGRLKYYESPGGLATCLRSVQENRDCIYVGWPGYWPANNQERSEITRTLLKKYSSYPVFISPWELERYYYGFSNQTLWPLFHYFPSYCSFESSHWQMYQKINRRFYNQVSDIAESSDILWVHDYHLLLLPQWLKRRFPQNPLGFFLHIPFPSPDLLTILPWKEQILFGLLGSDVVGFHTRNYTENFLNSIKKFLGYRHFSGNIPLIDRNTNAHEFPLGVDNENITAELKKDSTKKAVSKLKKAFSGKKIILSIDRMDYSKGIPQRLKGIEIFLGNNPKWLGKCQFIMLCQPSRTKIKHYTRLKESVDKMVGRINGRFGSPDWLPIRYMFRSLPFRRLLPLYSLADVALVTPWYDGMNLVAKEYVSSRIKKDGVLILSETAGAAKELKEALLINIHDKNAVAKALIQALQMNKDEITSRMEAMNQRILKNTSRTWMESFLHHLEKNTIPEKFKHPNGSFKAEMPSYPFIDTNRYCLERQLYQSNPEKIKIVND